MDPVFNGHRAITLQPPPDIKWGCENDIYRTLKLNPDLRKTILQDAADARWTPTDLVWVHHRLLFIPIPIQPDTTDVTLLAQIEYRLSKDEESLDV